MNVASGPVDWTAIGGVAGIASIIIAAMAFGFSVLIARQKTLRLAQEDVRREIKDSVNELRDILLEKLETKDAVNQIRVDIARIKGEMDTVRSEVNTVRELVSRSAPRRR